MRLSRCRRAGLGLSLAGGVVVGCSSFGADENSAASGDAGASNDSSARDVVGDGDASAEDASQRDRYREAVMADQPLAYFRFEEREGASARNEIEGSPSSAVYPATGITRGVEGISAGTTAAHFDDVTAVIGMFAAFPFAGDEAFSVEAWIRPDTPAAPAARLMSAMDDMGNNSGKRTGSWLFTREGGTLATETWSDGLLLFYANGATPVPSQSWTHIVFSHSPGYDKDLLYVNGIVSTDAARTNAGTRHAPTSAMRWGSYIGALDEVAIYPSSLPPARVVAHYLAR